MQYQDTLDEIDTQLRAQQIAYQNDARQELRRTNWKKYTVQGLKRKARYRNKLVTITESDLTQPEYCPVLGIKLDYQATTSFQENTASVDRIDNTKGYVSGNVHVISMKANRLKSNATVEELLKVANYFANIRA